MDVIIENAWELRFSRRSNEDAITSIGGITVRLQSIFDCGKYNGQELRQ